MQLWNVAAVIIATLPFRTGTLIGFGDSTPRWDAVSEKILKLLWHSSYRTVHFLKNDSASDMLISTVARSYKRPVDVHTGNYNKNDAAVVVVNSDSSKSIVLDNLKQIELLILVVEMVNRTEILPSIIQDVRATKIVKIAIVLFNGTEKAEQPVIHFSTFSRYRTRNCEIDNKFIKRNVSTEALHYNFQGCSMDVGISLMAPFTVKTTNGYDSSYSGVEVEMTKVLAEHFNFSIRFVAPPIGTEWGNLRENGSTGLMAMIQIGEVDFAIGSIARTLPRNTLLKAGVGSFYDRMVFALPPGIPYTPLQQLARPVTKNGWIFIVLACIAASVLFSCDIHEFIWRTNFEKCCNSITDVWSVLLGGVLCNPPENVFGKYVLLGWLMVTLVWRTAYQAILFGHLRSGVEFKPILTLEDIFEANFQFYMYNISQRFFVRNPQILMRSVIAKDTVSLEKVLCDMADNKLMVAFPLPKSNIEYFNKKRLFKSKVHISKYIIETYEAAIHYPIDTPLAALFDDMVLRVRAVGLHDFWGRKVRGTVKDDYVEHKKLQLQNLLGAFVIHGILCIFSGVIFITEVIVAKIYQFIGDV